MWRTWQHDAVAPVVNDGEGEGVQGEAELIRHADLSAEAIETLHVV